MVRSKCIAEYVPPKLVARMEYVMKENGLNAPCDRAVYLNYRALLESNQGNAIHAVKHLRRAVAILEKLPAEEQSERIIATISNSYSNLAMALSRDNKQQEAITAMQKALALRRDYSDETLMASHDTINQMMMLTRFFIASKQICEAEKVLDTLEEVVRTALGPGTLDEGLCKQLGGAIALLKRDFKTAEKRMLEAEEIIGGAVGDDNELTLAVRRDIHAFYLARGNRVKAAEYQRKMELAQLPESSKSIKIKDE